jgi:regulatory protein
MPFKPPKMLDREGLLGYAARALTSRGLSLNELRSRLQRRASQKEDIAAVIASLKEAGFLNDRKLADSVATWRRDNQGVGKTKVMRDLMSRRIAPAVAKQAVDTVYSGVDEMVLIQNFLERKYRGKNLGELLADQKHLASAFRKLRLAGFSSGNSIRALKRYAAEADQLEESAADDEQEAL